MAFLCAQHVPLQLPKRPHRVTGKKRKAKLVILNNGPTLRKSEGEYCAIGQNCCPAWQWQ
ncbi:hypothetical protein GH733_006730 [Mirounga leonina]|nr:hypothetical protein GH733_006730 [Mirounga leonina]